MYSVVHDPYPLVIQHTSVATGYFLVIRALQRATRNPDRATIGSLAPICPPLYTVSSCSLLGHFHASDVTLVIVYAGWYACIV